MLTKSELPDIHNIARAVDVDLCFPCALLARVRGLKDGREFFEGLSSSLDSEEVDDDNLNGNPATVHNVYRTSAQNQELYIFQHDLGAAYRVSSQFLPCPH